MLEQGTSNKLLKVSQNKMKILQMIAENKTIIKYSNQLGNIDIDNIIIGKKEMKDFYRNNLLKTPFSHDVQINDKVFIMVNPSRGVTTYQSSVSMDIYTITIACPVRYWYIDEKMIERPFVIAGEISKSLDQQRPFGIGQLNLSEWRTYRLNDDFMCLDLDFMVSDMAIKR